MTTKQSLVLLTPSLFFAIISITAFLVSSESLQDHTIDTNQRAKKNHEMDAKLESFVNNVTNGTWQLTTDQWIDRMQKACATIQAQRELQTELQLAQNTLTTTTRKLIRLLGWAAVAGFAFQMIAVLYFKQNKRNKASSLSQSDN